MQLYVDDAGYIRCKPGIQQRMIVFGGARGMGCAGLARKWILAIVGVCVVSGLGFAQDGRSSASELGLPIRVNGPEIMLIQDVQVPAETNGVLRAVGVDIGSQVKQGEELARIDDRVAKLNVALAEKEQRQAELESTSDIRVRAAEKTWELSVAEAQNAKELEEKRAMPYWEMMKKQLDAVVAKLQIEQAQLGIEIARATFESKQAAKDIAIAQLERHVILSPFAGLVVERLRQPGEYVREGDPILRLVSLDRLRIKGNVRASEVSAADLMGAKVNLEVQVTAQRSESLEAVVTWVNPVITVGDEFEVVIDFDNPVDGNDWLIKPGMPLQMLVHPRAKLAAQ
jgi:macrolide-specific efflux system membrane fusion protein